ncbi:MAG: biotin--[acetyl-CoA-carboxylase] ligase [Proteobacteria bacterium]|nr:biotin--[acetyl-CoA-carboxylase] ligase [Pseudomonadota bacterium]
MNSALSETDYRPPAGYGVAVCDEIDSTNEEAKRRVGEGMPGPTWFIARSQSAGKGRRGREWVSEPGNLYASLLLRPGASAAEAALLSFASALAVAEAIEEVTGVTRKLRCKWPNDVLYGGKKISGILLESASSKEGALDWLVIGVGINLAHFPPQTSYPATSIAAEGFAGITAPDLFAALARRMDGWLETWRQEGFPPIRKAWLARAAGLGEAMVARTGSEDIAGRFRGLGPGGALLIEIEDGSLREILAGDVFPALTGA